MKLYITAPSPFARKCRIVAREKALMGRIEERLVDPYANAPELLETNPIVQVPTLVAQDGRPITDSPLICDYLDRLGDGPRLLPADGEAWLKVKRLETLGIAALEMGVKLVLELRRPEHERSPGWISRWRTNLNRALDAIEDARPDPETIDMGTITAAVAATWMGFRHPDIDWADGRPVLADLQAAMEARESFIETKPQ